MNKTKYAIGVDLGGSSIKLGIVSNSGRIIKKVTVRTEAEKGKKQVIENIKSGIIELISSKKRSDYKIEGIGIGCPGVVTPGKGIVEDPPNLPGWKKVNIGEIIQKEFKENIR